MFGAASRLNGARADVFSIDPSGGFPRSLAGDQEQYANPTVTSDGRWIYFQSRVDSIGWAYFKDGKLELALEHLKRAADQLGRNSVIQDHYGDVLFKLGRFDDAVAAWDRAIAGDGDDVERGEIDRKIKSARQKSPKR